jgi:hypothetical protein
MLKITAERKEKWKWEALPVTSILPKLLPYRRLKIFAIFAVVGSLESVGMQQLRQYATTLAVIGGKKLQNEKETDNYSDGINPNL